MSNTVTLLHVTDPQFQVIQEVMLENVGHCIAAHDLEIEAGDNIVPGIDQRPPEYSGEPKYTFTLTWFDNRGQAVVSGLLKSLAPVTMSS